MSKRVIAATSTSCLDYADKPHGVRILRLHVHVDGKDMLDGSDITSAQFQQWQLQNPGKAATTSPPTQNEMMRFFCDLMAEGFDEVLVLTISSQLSQTYQMLQPIRRLFAGKMHIEVFDTGAASFAEGVYALAADNWLRHGHDIDTIIHKLQAMRDSTNAYFTLDKLDYLVKSGRVSAPAGMLANFICIKPLLQITGGQIKPVARVRSLERALESLVDTVFAFVGNRSFEIYGMGSGVHRTNDMLADMVRSKFRMRLAHSYPITPVVCAHTGPGGIGLGVVLGHRVLA